MFPTLDRHTLSNNTAVPPKIGAKLKAAQDGHHIIV